MPLQAPNEIELRTSLNHQAALLTRIDKWLELAYLSQQEQKSTETPRSYRPLVYNLVAGLTPGQINAIQVLGRNFARFDVSIYNVGPGTILYSNAQFDPASMLQQLSDPAHPNTITPSPNQAIQIGYLPAGSSVTINSTDAVWAWNNGSNALLVMTEVIYARAGNQTGPMPALIPGLDGAIGQGYGNAVDADGNGVAVKGLR